jgi:hypothetical protein
MEREMATMRKTLTEAVNDAKLLGYRKVYRFKTGYKAISTSSCLGVEAWDALRHDGLEAARAVRTKEKGTGI